MATLKSLVYTFHDKRDEIFKLIIRTGFLKFLGQDNAASLLSLFPHRREHIYKYLFGNTYYIRCLLESCDDLYSIGKLFPDKESDLYKLTLGSEMMRGRLRPILISDLEIFCNLFPSYKLAIYNKLFKYVRCTTIRDLKGALKVFPEKELDILEYTIYYNDKFIEDKFDYKEGQQDGYTDLYLISLAKKIFPMSNIFDAEHFANALEIRASEREVRKNARLLFQASRDNTNLISILPYEVLTKIAALTGNEKYSNNKSILFAERCLNTPTPSNSTSASFSKLSSAKRNYIFTLTFR